MRKQAPIIFAVICTVSAFLNALLLTDRIRLVDILTLFFGGFGAGAGVVKTVLDIRSRRKENAEPKALQ